MLPPFDERPSWLKSRGYLHITPKIDIFKRYEEIYTKVQDEKFVARHGFFPLIHSVIKERKFKKVPSGAGRAHSYKEKGVWKKTAKLRPLHYATHIDSLIFGYYAELLLTLYEKELDTILGLSECVTAYRKIEVDGVHDDEKEVEIIDEKSIGKSTIHFANEAFNEIKNRAHCKCVVLMFDIKSFFSDLDHERLKEAWIDLLKVERLNDAHYNVFKAATEFRYILKDELRTEKKGYGRRSGFDEKKLASIRRKFGKEAFFESTDDFRDAVKNKDLAVYKHPFMKKGKPVGIPQGLPISAVLANLYLLEFDKQILKNVVIDRGGFYRRYSDDILIVCKPEEADAVEKCVLTEIELSLVKISKEKTEKYLFKEFQVSPYKKRLTSILLGNTNSKIGKPLTYLGFEFYGDKTLIKSANIAKFYRRMVSTVKKKSNRAKVISSTSELEPAVFRGKIRKIYTLLKLDSKKQYSYRNLLKRDADGQFAIKRKKIKKRPGTNYFSYAKRASDIMEEHAIQYQLRNHKAIFNKAIARHLKEKPDE